MLRFQAGFFLVILVIIGLGTSCTSEKAELRIITDRPELALFLEGYTAQNKNINISLEFKPDLADLFRNNTVDADLVVGTGLVNPVVLEGFLSLDGAINDGELELGQLIASSQIPGNLEGSKRAVILGFDLPLVFGNSENLPKGGDFYERYLLDLDTIRDTALQGNRIERGRFTRLGFSPIMSESFQSFLASVSGAQFKSGSQGEPLFIPSAITRSIEVAKTWVTRSAGSIEAEILFANTYGYLPTSFLLKQKRLGLAFGSLSEFFRIPIKERATFSFAWPGNDQQILVNPDLLAVGIPQGTRNLESALDFMGYLMETKSQREYLENVVSLGLNDFGFLGFVSSNRYIYEQVLGQVYTELLGIMPAEEVLKFPESVPVGWRSWKQDILEPYLRSGIETGASIEVLQRRTRQWLLQQGLNVP